MLYNILYFLILIVVQIGGDCFFMTELIELSLVA